MRDPKTPEFIDLLLNHEGDLMRLILPLVGNAEDARDVLQETAKSLWQKFDQYDSSRPFMPWAKQFARNECMRMKCRKRRIAFLTDDLLDQLIEKQEAGNDLSAARQAALGGCLKKLSQDDRKLLQRRYVEAGVTVQQLANETGQTANVLYKSLGRIRYALLKCIEQAVAAQGFA